MKVFGPETYTPMMAAESLTSLDDGRRALGTLLEQYPDTDTIFCSADILTLSVLMETERCGIAMSTQSRVVDYNDQMFARDTTPALTTIRTDGIGIGKLAATSLVNHIEHGDEERRAIDVGLTLAERGSA